MEDDDGELDKKQGSQKWVNQIKSLNIFSTEKYPRFSKASWDNNQTITSLVKKKSAPSSSSSLNWYKGCVNIFFNI